LKFDIAVSLGATCQPRYHISRLLHVAKHGSDADFRIDENGGTSQDYGSHFFDWSVTPTKGLLRVLGSDFRGVMRLANLRILQLDEGKQTVLDEATGQRYPHTFKGTQTGSLTAQELAIQYPDVKAKFDYVVDKTRRLLDSKRRILFVRCGFVPDASLAKLLALLGARVADFSLLYVPWSRTAEENDPSVMDRRVIHRPSEHAPYPGSSAAWTRAFEGISLAPPSSGLFGQLP
jgi:hypothetical protein